jgi:hypothetical protein
VSARASAACALALLALAAAPAHAAPAFDALPSGTFPSLPRPLTGPAHLDAAERAPGLQVTRGAGYGARRYVELATPEGYCLRDAVSLAPADAAPTMRATALRSEAGVLPVRVERLVELAAGATLEVADVWVDATTGGARLAAVVVLPLAELARAAGGARVYGLRVGETLHVVAASPAGAFVRDADGEAGFTSCSHARVTLRAAPGAGEAAQLFVPAAPPSADARGSLLVSASVSQLSRDPSPLVSVHARAIELARPPAETFSPDLQE